MRKKKTIPDIHEVLQATIDDNVEKRVKEVLEENKQLNETVLELTDKVDELLGNIDQRKEDDKTSALMLTCLNQIKTRVTSLNESDKRNNFIMNFLEIVFTPDFEENTYDCPLWLSAVTNFYSSRKIVIDILRLFDVYLPQNIDCFRLPMDWTEEELDIVFETMPKHIVCNSCTFENNLRFWTPFSLLPVEKVCATSTYTEIPWQFLLRNPLIKKEKYLKKIGEMAFKESHVRGWCNLFHIQEYQTLSDNEIKTIITNMNPYGVLDKSIDHPITAFLLKNFKYLKTDSPFIESLYEMYKNTYTFRSKNVIMHFPEKYIDRWIVETEDPFSWIKTNADKFTEDQKERYLKIGMERLLKIV